jgi:hypothetical protein
MWTKHSEEDALEVKHSASLERRSRKDADLIVCSASSRSTPDCVIDTSHDPNGPVSAGVFGLLVRDALKRVGSSLCLSQAFGKEFCFVRQIDNEFYDETSGNTRNSA